MSKEALISSYAAHKLFSDYMSSLKLVLELELKKKPASKEECIEMNGEIWSRLPQELLMLVLAKLPTLIIGKFRAVCKGWKFLLSPPGNTFKRISSAVSNSSPAFLIGDLSFSHMKNSVLNDLYVLQSAPTSRIYRFSLDFLGAQCGSVVTSCKSLLCYCCCREGAEPPTLFYICNPVLRTWKMLPPLVEIRSRQDFIGLTFDSFTRTCILVTGENRGYDNKKTLVMEIYDSETDSWTKLEMNTPMSLFPTGEGVYSRGNFYWINKTQVGSMFRFDVAAFNVADRSWDVIKQPKRSDGHPAEKRCYWKLTGNDGKVVLVNNKDMCLWKLNEDVKEKEYSWLELQSIPTSLCEEALTLHGLNDANDLSRQRNPQNNVGFSYNLSQVVVNGCGWILVHLYGKRLVVLDAEGRMMRSIEGKLLTVFEQAASPLPIQGYEVNNVWWP